MNLFKSVSRYDRTVLEKNLNIRYPLFVLYYDLNAKIFIINEIIIVFWIATKKYVIQ